MQACGSGGTSAGLAIANEVEKYGARIWAYGVCDTPDMFYDKVEELVQELGIPDCKPWLPSPGFLGEAESKFTLLGVCTTPRHGRVA